MTAGASKALTVAEAHARLRARTDIQFDLPPAPKPQPPPEWIKSLGELFSGAAPFGSFLFWAIIAIVVALIVWRIAASVIARRRSGDAVAEPDQEVAAWRPEEKVARALLAEADAMAAAGRYDEAARLLLHRSLEDIQRRRPSLLRPALTSREIARTPQLPDLVRGAFTAMAQAVERSLFGGRGLASSDWEAARAAYGEFALPGAWK